MPAHRVGAVLLALAAASGCSPETRAAPDRVVLVTVDTLRADHVGCYGASDAHTPTLDTVAARGVRFEVAISPVPLTLPAHASLFTALDPPSHGVRHNSLYRLPDDVPTLTERMRAAGFGTAAFVGAAVLDGRFGLDRGFEVYDDTMGDDVSGMLGYAERSAAAVVDAALAWLARAPARFFLWVHFYDPHAAYAPPPGFRSAFASRPYAGEIAFADAQLGRLLEALERLDAEPGGGTLLAVTSDHGESLGEHGELTHSYTLYDATQRVPLLLAGPGLPRGRVVAEPVRLLDVAPTLLALAGAEALPDVAGRDLRGSLEDAAEAPPVYLETLAPRLDHAWSPLLGLRTARFKYIRAPRPELYDLAADPAERRDLAAERPEVARRLDRQLEALRGDSRPPLRVALPESERARLRALGYVVPDAPGVTPDPHADPGEMGSTAAEQALEELEAIGGPDPKDEMETLRVLAEAQAAAGEGHPREALELLDGIESEGPNVLALRASLALASDLPERAERSARAVLSRQPERPDLLVILARSLERQERLAEAAAAFARAGALDPTASAAFTGLGRCLEGLGHPEKAARAYGDARTANPRSLEPVWRLALLHLRGGRVAEAEELVAGLEPAARRSLAEGLRPARESASAGDGELERLRILLSPQP